jgi:hypothetical protein
VLRLEFLSKLSIKGNLIFLLFLWKIRNVHVMKV